MDHARLRQVEELFHAAVSLSAQDREAFLRQACGADQDLFRHVQALLVQDVSGPMDKLVFEVAADLLEIPATSWTPGTMVGPYRIERLLGEGGMGDVYKARDTRLNRDVAIKTAKQGFGSRFQREARAISALNHPHICTLYDIGPDYLVMEFIDGAPISGPMPVAAALSHATQIASALRHAHHHGVVHRDLKPGNILLTKAGVKVLDFGLAKMSAAGTDPDATRHDSALTVKGAILGTLRYMSPEQLKGAEADRRSDIFAFGVVLYELLTGQPPFHGDSQAGLIASILTAEVRPDPGIPPALDRLIRACTAKDPDRRRQTMQDVLLDLEWIVSADSPPAPRRTFWLTAGIACAATLAALAFAFPYFRQPPVSNRFAVRLQQYVPPGVFMWGDMPAVSPDGRSFAYALDGDGVGKMWLRRLDQAEAHLLPHTEGALFPFWSPDSSHIGYYSRGQLKVVPAGGGTSQVVCNIPKASIGTWSPAGVIVFSTSDGAIYRVPASGGEPNLMAPVEAGRRHMWPHFLPNGRQFLFTTITASGAGSVSVRSIDSPEVKHVLDSTSNVAFVEPGFLLFLRGRTLMAQPFSASTLQLSGSPFPVVEQIARTSEKAVYSASPNGTLVYWREDAIGVNLLPTWYDRTGRKIASIGPPRSYRQGTLSPDEKRMALQVYDPATNRGNDFWMLDLGSGVLSRLTAGDAFKDTVVWSPDGKEILFGANNNGVVNPFRKPVGGGEERLIHPFTQGVFPAQWLPDGSMLFLTGNGRSFVYLSSSPGAKPAFIHETDFNKDEPRVSPDGHWVVYNSTESGAWEVYIAAFPSFSGRRQISTNGGAQGYWRKDGREVFYLSPDGHLVSVPINPGSPPEAGIPKPLFRTRIPFAGQFDLYAASADGQRFLLLEASEDQRLPFQIIVDWPALLKKQ